MTDLILIDRNNWPSIYEACELIAHDGGRQAGHVNYGIPMEYQDKLIMFERQLYNLRMEADSDFECLCTGDEEESQNIVRGYNLQELDKFLQRFAEEFR